MVFRCFLQESIFRPNGRLSHIACHKYASAVNCSYQETTLVHPTRRQSFAGKMDSTFYNIWDLVIYIIPTSREHRNIAQLCTIYTCDWVKIYLVPQLCRSLCYRVMEQFYPPNFPLNKSTIIIIIFEPWACTKFRNHSRVYGMNDELTGLPISQIKN